MVVGKVFNGGSSVGVFQPHRGTVVIRNKFQLATNLDKTMKNFILQTYQKVSEDELLPDEELNSDIQEDAVATLVEHVKDVKTKVIPDWIVELYAYIAIEEDNNGADESKMSEYVR